MAIFIPHRCPKCFESVTLIQPQHKGGAFKGPWLAFDDRRRWSDCVYGNLTQRVAGGVPPKEFAIINASPARCPTFVLTFVLISMTQKSLFPWQDKPLPKVYIKAHNLWSGRECLMRRSHDPRSRVLRFDILDSIGQKLYRFSIFSSHPSTSY